MAEKKGVERRKYNQCDGRGKQLEDATTKFMVGDTQYTVKFDGDRVYVNGAKMESWEDGPCVFIGNCQGNGSGNSVSCSRKGSYLDSYIDSLTDPNGIDSRICQLYVKRRLKIGQKFEEERLRLIESLNDDDGE